MERDHGLFGRENDTPLIQDEEIIFTSQNANMDYLTVKGIETRTGVEKDSLPGFVTKELLDNAADFMESQHTINPKIEISISKQKSFLQIKVGSSSNGKQIFSKDMLESIFNFEKAYSSKRNQYKITRGALGDAFKEIVCAPYALARDSNNNNPQQQWNEPLIIRNNKTFKVYLVIDRAKNDFYSKIFESESELEIQFDVKRNSNSNTIEVETRLPLTDKSDHTINEIERFIIDYALLNTHIEFSIYLPNGKFHHLYQTQPMLAKWSNQTSIYYYSLQEFEDFISGLDDNEMKIYNVLYNASFREVSNISKSDFPQITVGQLKLCPTDVENIYKLLHDRETTKMGPPTELSLPFNIKQAARKKAIEDRLKQVGIPYKLVKYKQKSDYYLANGIQVPFFFEVTIVHSDSPPINLNLDLIESLNSSTMPNNYQVFYGSYEDTFIWSSSKGDSIQHGESILDILKRYGYSHNEKDCKKKHSVIIANLISPKIDFRSYGKSSIDVTPFAKVIAETTAKACMGGSDKNGKVDQLVGLREILEERKIKYLLLLDPIAKKKQQWTQSDVFYATRKRLIDKYGYTDQEINRDHITKSIRKECVKLGITREGIGILAADRAQLYFKGKWSDVGLEEIDNQIQYGTDMIIIEKEGVIAQIGLFADDKGIALLNTRGFLTEYASKLAKKSAEEGCIIWIVTDLDDSGLLMSLMARKGFKGIKRIGIDFDTIKELRLKISDVEEEYVPGKHLEKVKKEKDEDLRYPKEILTYVSTKRIEINSVMTALDNNTKFWEWIVLKLTKKPVKRNYNRSVDIPKYVIPGPLEKLNDIVEEKSTTILEKPREKLQKQLSNINNGFLFDRTNKVLPEYNIEKYKKSLTEQARKIIESNPKIKSLLENIEDLVTEQQVDHDTTSH
jgi:DNA topoisomerase VI subunit B